LVTAVYRSGSASSTRTARRSRPDVDAAAATGPAVASVVREPDADLVDLVGEARQREAELPLHVRAQRR
jgi:hypothetical protein